MADARRTSLATLVVAIGLVVTNVGGTEAAGAQPVPTSVGGATGPVVAGGVDPDGATGSPDVSVGAVEVRRAVPLPRPDDVDDIDEARRQRESTDAQLRTLDAQVRRASDEVAALDQALLEATTTLAVTRDARDEALVDLEAARVLEQQATDALVTANAALDAALADWRSDRDRLADRAVHAYKHGGGAASEVLVRGVASAGDWHEVAVTIEAVARLTAGDRHAVDRAADATREETVLRAEVRAAREQAIAATTAADAHARRLEDLEAAHQRAAVEAQDRLDERATVLTRLQADVEVVRALRAELDTRIEVLERAAARALVPVVVDLDPFGPPPGWATGLPGGGPRWAAAIDAIAQRHGLDPRLLAALVWTESNFRADAVSHAGALGLAQLMPGTARGLGVDPRDPLANLDGGARYLRTQLDRFGRVDLALAAYNAGPGRVERVGRIPNIVETQLYVVRVLERYERLGG